jgi:tRNA (guanine37-N1)-methyltransferase
LDVCVISLFPAMVKTIATHGVVGRALEQEIVSLRCINPRDYATDVHRTVDDRPYGGGPGMVMQFAPLAAAIDAARREAPYGTPVVCMSPQGAVFDQAMARRFSRLPGLILLAGRYEGIDERLIDAAVDEEVSLGDFVLSGGEVAAMAVFDAVTRLLPGTLGDETSALQDSFSDGLLDHPHFTRPEEIDGRHVPDVLLSGDHARIARWRRKQALGRTYTRRPELLRDLHLSDEQQELLAEFLEDNSRADR